ESKSYVAFDEIDARFLRCFNIGDHFLVDELGPLSGVRLNFSPRHTHAGTKEHGDEADDEHYPKNARSQRLAKGIPNQPSEHVNGSGQIHSRQSCRKGKSPTNHTG